MSEPRPRQHRLVNPEHAVALLRRIVEAWDSSNGEVAFTDALREARTLLGIERPPRKQNDVKQ